MSKAQKTEQNNSWNTLGTVIIWGIIIWFIIQVYNLFTDPNFSFFMDLCRNFGGNTTSCFMQLLFK